MIRRVFRSIRRIFRSVKSRRSTKINKRKKFITCLFETQITIYIFFWVVFKGHYKLTLKGVFRVRRVHLVPPNVDLGFLYPKLSQIFYWQYFFKKLRIRYCRSWCYKINYCWWSKVLNRISKSQTWVFMWNKFR